MTLAERDLLGYDAHVELHANFEDDTYTVIIEDALGRTEWTAEDRARAKDMYFHPFAFGYNAPEEDAA